MKGKWQNENRFDKSAQDFGTDNKKDIFHTVI
jgi:hypothetical protein